MNRTVPGIVWAERAVESEVALSAAYGGIVEVHRDFVHVRNEAVPWGGDFNRAVDVRAADIAAFDEVVWRVERIHRNHGLDPPDRFDLRPPALAAQRWDDDLARRGVRRRSVLFFQAPARVRPLPGASTLRSPSGAEYLAWYRRRVGQAPYFDEEWFRRVRPLQARFATVFRPWWLLERGEVVAWAHCAVLGTYARLFGVEVAEGCRGRGLGSRLLSGVVAASAHAGAGHVLLQSDEERRPFYEGAGFVECVRSSVVQGP